MARPSTGTLEERSAPADAPPPRIEGNTLRGLVPYGVESRDLGGWRERLAPGCLTAAALGDLVATVNHDVSRLLGRHPTTLRTEERDDGLAWECDLPNGPTGQDVREAVSRGDLNATSWRMVVGRDSWHGTLRTVEEIRELRDVAVVTHPAYPTTAELRHAPDAPAPAPPTSTPEPEEAPTVSDPTLTPAGGLRVEDRSADAGPPSIETRVLDGLRSIHKGEARSLNTVNANALTPEEQGSFMWDRLRPASVMLAAGVRIIPTNRESVVWPRLTSDVSPDWYAEEELIVAGDPAFGTLEAKPKKLAHRVELSNEVIDDSEPSIVDVLNVHLAAMLALKLDASMLIGNPATNADSIRGLKFQPGIQTISGATNGGPLTSYDPFIKAIGLLRDANVPGPYAVVMTARDLTALELLREATGSNLQLGAPAGLPPIYTTTQLPVNETKGTATNASSAYVFAPAEIVLVRRLDAEILLDRSRLFDRDMSEMRAKARADLIVPNPAAVVRIDGITPAA